MIVLGLGLGIWRVFFYQSEVSKGTAALAYAYREQRPLEARISGFNYAPAANTRGEQVKVDQVALDRAERILLNAVFEHPGPAANHALGRFYLAERQFDKAISQFEEALKVEPNSAQLHSDLGAAFLEKGKADRLQGESGKSFEELGRSNEHLSKAIELDGSLLESLFNRALCHENLLLYREAEKDWRDYLERDPNSAWAGEAGHKLKELLERPAQSPQGREELFQDFLRAQRGADDEQAWKTISQSRDSTGSFIENKLIDNYLDQAARGRRHEASESLVALSYPARVERQKPRDLFISNLLWFYKSATLSQRERVLQARSLAKRAREGVSRYDFDEAIEFYKRAKQTFEAAGDECEVLYTAYEIANCYLQQAKAESALSVFQPLAEICEKSEYRWLLGQILSAMANANLYLRDFSAAMENSERSINLSRAIGDRITLIKTLFQLAEECRFVNNERKALDLHAQDLSLTYAFLPQSTELWPNYFSISLTFYQLGMYVTAIDFQREALHLTIEAEKPRSICRSSNYLGMLLARHGDYAEAKANIERALDIGNTFTERKVRIEATAYSFLQLGYIYRQLGDFTKAIENYDQAIQSYDELDSKFFAYTARKDKVLCCLEKGGCDSVEQEIGTLLNLFESHRSKILEESNRSTYFDAEQSVYDMVIEYEYYNKNDATRAFEYSERSRGRSLRDLINTSIKVVDNPDSPNVRFEEISQPTSLEEIESQTPQQAQILQYAVLKTSILIWVVSKGESRPFTASQSIAIGDLNKRVNDFLQLIKSGSEDDFESFSREAAWLYDLLIKPVEGWLDGNKQVCIVPDKVLNYLPFAALKSRTSGKYFIEEREHGFVLSPSSSMFVISSEAARKKASSESERLLSVGNPLFDHKRFSNLDDLQSAAREAEAITSYYGSRSPRPLIGASATKKRVVDEMEKSEVIHLATHAVADEWYPLRSKLLLAKDASGQSGNDGVLQAYEIYKLNLERAKLVVLSACRTGVEKYYGGEGMVGLSRPFIAKRIPLVVASLWSVNSGSTADLMIDFHRYRKVNGLPTAEALRAAQIKMLRDSNSDKRVPYHWASFVAIGGYAPF